jgi:hypothetical protein
VLLSLASVARAAHARGDDSDPLRSSQGGVTIDWKAGTLSAEGGAAADLRMPTVDLARPGAERRARQAALGKLRAALATLPLGGGRALGAAEIDRAASRARTVDLQYQSNGGAVTRLQIRFADWIDNPQPSTITLAAPAMALGAAPRARVGGRDTAFGAATFRIGAAPASVKALAAKVDGAGRLVIAAGNELADKVASAVALIYVEKVQP